MNYENFASKASLDQQFAVRQKIEAGGQKLELVDLSPDYIKTETPVVLGLGWGGEPAAYKNNIISLANAGRRVVSVDAVHGIDYKKSDAKFGALPEAELRKVAALIEALENKKIFQADAVGYSEGGIYVTLAALLYPEKFRNLVLVNPGGMIGQDNEARLTAGFLRDLVKHFVQSFGDKEKLSRWAKVYGGMVKSAAKDLPKALSEISAISDAQIENFLEELKSSGMGISIIHSVDDHAFPMDRMQRVVKPDYVDGFYSVKGAHADFVIQAEKYSHVVDQALDALERKKMGDN